MSIPLKSQKEKVSGDQPNTICYKQNIFKSKSEQFQEFCDAFAFVGFSFPKIKATVHPDGKIKKEMYGSPHWGDINQTTIHPNHKAFAVKTGNISKITGLDVDSEDAYTKITKDFPQLLNSLTIKTRKGYHIYCKYHPDVPLGTQNFQSYPDIDIRNDDGILFGPCTNYIAGDEIYSYDLFQLAEPVDFPQELINDIKPKRKTSKSTKKKYFKCQFNNPNSKVINEYRKLLNELDENYYNDTILWSNVGAALHWSRDCIAFFDLWVQFSKKSKIWKPTLKNLKDRWMHYDSNAANAATTGTLKFYHQHSHNTTHINYNLLNLPRTYDPFKDIEAVSNLNIHYVKRKFVWDSIHPARNVLPQRGRILANNDDTGRGKTHATREYRRCLGNPPLIVPTPRRVVAKQSAQYFDLQYYEDVVQRNELHSVNESIQIDSLHKMPVPNQSFMLFLDEFDQIAEHFLAQLPGMSYNRLTNLDRFSDLIQAADYIVIADANLSTRSLRFLRNLTDKPIDLFVNQIKEERPQSCNFYPNLKTIRNHLIFSIQQNNKFFCCSDRLDLFEKLVIAPIRAMFPYKHFIVHSSEDKHLDVLCDVTVHWQNFDGVFTTPAVTSGIDYNPVPQQTHAVFAFYFGGIDAIKNNQQINRIRNPTDINIWCAHSNNQNLFSVKSCKSNLDLLAHCTNAHKLVVDIYDHHLSNVLLQLHADSQYLNQCLSNHTQHHLTQLLKNKGYGNIAEIVNDDDDLLPRQFLSDQFYINYRQRKVHNDLQDEFHKLQDYYPNLEPQDIDNLLVDRNFGITAFRYFQFEIDKKYKPRFDDVVSAAYSIQNQRRLCLKLTKKLNLQWLQFNFEKDMKDIGPQTPIFVEDQLISEIFGIFQIHHKPPKVNAGRKCVHSYANLYQVLMRMIQHIYPKFITYHNTEDSLTIKNYSPNAKGLLRFVPEIVETLNSGQ